MWPKIIVNSHIITNKLDIKFEDKMSIIFFKKRSFTLNDLLPSEIYLSLIWKNNKWDYTLQLRGL